jgi:D-amino-acid oxidase
LGSFDNRVAVIGGGIAGLTTAILLQANGYRTFLYAKDRPGPILDVGGPPEFASLHAAASVLPHSAKAPEIAEWTSISYRFFRALSFQATCGVRSQDHYEVFEEESVDRPDYFNAVERFEMLGPESLRRSWVPRRSGADQIAGWRFQAFFCEAPVYLRYLYDLYEFCGGRIVDRAHSLLEFLGLDYQLYVNCTGSAAYDLLAAAVSAPEFRRHFQDDDLSPANVPLEPLLDPYRPKLILGHYLRVDLKEMLIGQHDRMVSYNYKPTPAVYRTGRGDAADVYCYPRSDAWILGGSRQVGTRNRDGSWEWEPTIGATIDFNSVTGGSVAVPAPIFNLNADLLRRMTSGLLDLDEVRRRRPRAISAGVGYRSTRDSEDHSVRLSVSRLRSRAPTSQPAQKYVLHNYGHGGSGYTLSWGCAFKIMELLDAITERDPPNPVPRDPLEFMTSHDATLYLILDQTGRLTHPQVLRAPRAATRARRTS